MVTKNDEGLWAAVVDAERELHARRAAFYQKAQDRATILAGALKGSAWERGAALSFLTGLSDDVPALLELLVDNSMTHAFALDARRAIWSRRSAVQAQLQESVERRLVTADDDEYRRLAELLDYLDDRETLRRLIQTALDSPDPEINEVGADFGERDSLDSQT